MLYEVITCRIMNKGLLPGCAVNRRVKQYRCRIMSYYRIYSDGRFYGKDHIDRVRYILYSLVPVRILNHDLIVITSYSIHYTKLYEGRGEEWARYRLSFTGSYFGWRDQVWFRSGRIAGGPCKGRNWENDFYSYQGSDGHGHFYR